MTVCDLCKGTGKLLKPWYDTTGAMTGMTGDICFMCDGKGTIGEPMTNEEWIKSLDTEGLVDYLYEVHKGGNSVERQRWIERHKEQVKMQFRGWLKEKHE